MVERWRSVVGFPDYQVSSIGRARSVKRVFVRPNRKDKSKMDRVLLPQRFIDGWVRRREGRPVCVFVTLRKDGRSFTFRLHRLVLSAFRGECQDGMEGCHNDGNPENNKISNLRWDHHQGNMADQVAHGTRSNPPIHRGESHPQAKLTDSEVAEIRSTVYTYGVQTEMARRFNVSTMTISRIRKGISR